MLKAKCVSTGLLFWAEWRKSWLWQTWEKCSCCADMWNRAPQLLSIKGGIFTSVLDARLHADTHTQTHIYIHKHAQAHAHKRTYKCSHTHSHDCMHTRKSTLIRV